MGSENVVKQKKFTEMDTEFELELKSKDKELTLLFWNKIIVSDFSTRFFSERVACLKHGSSYGG